MSNELQNLNAWMAQLASKHPSAPIQVQEPIVPSANWRDDYYRALTVHWTRVFEVDETGRRHDHTPMPPAASITSLQAQLIERPAKKEAKRKPLTPPYRHKLCVEAWTVPQDQIVRHKNQTQWRRFAQLRSDTGFDATINKATKDGYTTTEFKDWAIAKVFGRSHGNALWGVFHDNNGGWNYYDEHLVKLDLNDPAAPRLYLWRNRELICDLVLEAKFAGHAFPDGSTETHNGRLDT